MQYGVGRERFNRTVGVAFELLGKKLPKGLAYHNMDHTEAVYSAALALAKAEKLSEYYTEMLLIAAAFHDVGFIEKYDSNERIGARIARETMTKESYPEDDMVMVENLIVRGTTLSADPNGIERQHPITRLERVLADADLFYLSGKYGEYSKTAGLLRKEREAQGIKVDELEWERSLVKFLSLHKFLSEGARELDLQTNQKANLEIEKQYLRQLEIER